jgi:hypothetical protein
MALPLFIQLGSTDSTSDALMRFNFSIVNLLRQSLESHQP